MIKKIGNELWNELATYSEAINRIPNWEETKNPEWLDYKPAYRALSILLGQSDLRKKYFDGKRPTYEECTEILRETHPSYFNAYFDDQWDAYIHLLNDMYEIWCEMGEHKEDIS